MLAIVDAYRKGLLQPKNWLSNILSGLIVGIVALPLAMAFAIASGAKPEQGLYTAIVAAIIVGLFGGSRVQIAGPTGAFIVILAQITADHGISGLQIATLLAGCMLILMGVMRLGTIIKFIPDPVIVGFTAGIGFIIFVGEWKDFFGLQIHLPLNAHFHQKLLASLSALPHLSLTNTSLALLSLLLIILSPKLFKRLPGPLVAMVIATGLQFIFHFNSIPTIGSLFGGIPEHLPQFSVPSFSFERLIELLGPAFAIALLGAIESLLSATAADGMANTRHDSNQELIGQGLANILAPLFGGFAATGAIARTATNVRNGGNCAISALVHSLFLILVIILLAPLASYVPLYVLAAILCVVAYNMSDLPHFIYIIKRAPRSDALILVTTFFLTVFTDLVIAVNVGVILAMVFFIRHMIRTVDIEEQSNEKLKHELQLHDFNLPNDVLIYTIQGPFFFGAAEKLERTLAITHTNPKKIIFRLQHVPFIDATGLQTFKELIQGYQERGIKTYLCEGNTRVNKALSKIGLTNHIEGGRIFTCIAEVL